MQMAFRSVCVGSAHPPDLLPVRAFDDRRIEGAVSGDVPLVTKVHGLDVVVDHTAIDRDVFPGPMAASFPCSLGQADRGGRAGPTFREAGGHGGYTSRRVPAFASTTLSAGGERFAI